MTAVWRCLGVALFRYGNHAACAGGLRVNVEPEPEATAHAQDGHRQLQSARLVGHQLCALT